MHDYIVVQLPNLKEDEIYISHVGDGEYSFNVFGSAHLNLMKYLSKLAKNFKCKVTDFYFIHYKDWNGNINSENYYIRISGEKGDVASLTIEKIDPENFPIVE